MAKLAPDQWLYIYGLRDPRTGEMRYVGSSCNPKVRLHQHISDLKYANTGERKHRWLSQLVGLGLRPHVEILMRVQEKNRHEFEAWWITEYTNRGARLVNVKLSAA